MACNASTRSEGEKVVAETAKLDERLPEQKAPAELRRKCDDPVVIPHGKLNAGPLERMWRKDRIALVECGEKHQRVIEFYEDRDARIAATTGK